MSYDIRLCDPVSGETLKSIHDHDMRGGTYIVGGTNELWLNITYNYSKFYREVYPKKGIRILYNKTAVESISILEKMINEIKKNHPTMEFSNNYWDALPGNAVRPLYQLLAMARLRPDGVWKGD